MSSKVLIPFLCVGAVAFACGPRAHNEASTPRKDSVALASSKPVTAPVAMQQGSATRSTRKSGKVEAELFVRTTGNEISLALHVVNNTKKNVELTFATGQTHDFIVVDSVGREVWRWAQGRMFTQTLRNKLLGGGETLEVEERVKDSLAPGRYTARAVLKSTNYPLEQSAEFTISSTSLALK
jgi:hypothetical protein